MLLNVTIGGLTKYLPEERPIAMEVDGEQRFVTNYRVPYVEGGEQALMESDQLTCIRGGHDNDNETVRFVEFWEGSELRHRSVDIKLKKGLGIKAFEGTIG